MSCAAKKLLNAVDVQKLTADTDICEGSNR